MSWKSDRLVPCLAGCGAEVKECRMAHHLRHHCVARYRKRNRKSRRYRRRWNRKQIRPVEMRKLLRCAKRIPGLNGASIYVRGCRVIIEQRMVRWEMDISHSRSW